MHGNVNKNTRAICPHCGFKGLPIPHREDWQCQDCKTALTLVQKSTLKPTRSLGKASPWKKLAALFFTPEWTLINFAVADAESSSVNILTGNIRIKPRRPDYDCQVALDINHIPPGKVRDFSNWEMHFNKQIYPVTLGMTFHNDELKYYELHVIGRTHGIKMPKWKEGDEFALEDLFGETVVWGKVTKVYSNS